MATVLITGANRGIGLALARAYVERGDTVLAACRLTSEALTALGVTVFEGVEVSDDAAVDGLATALGDTEIDILINNAAIHSNETLEDLSFERIRKGETIEAVAADAAADAKVETSAPLTRATTPQGLSRAAVAQAFALGKGSASSADTQDGSSRHVFIVKEVVPAPAPTKEQRARLVKELEGNLESDAITAYVEALQRRLGTYVNQTAFDRLSGVTQ